MWILLALVACQGQAEVVDICDTVSEDTVDTGIYAVCQPCKSDSDCAFQGNSCTETTYCAHVDASIAVVEIGCSKALEYKWPDDEDCLCVDQECHYTK